MKNFNKVRIDNITFLKIALLSWVFGGCRLQKLLNILTDPADNDRGEVIAISETKTIKKLIVIIVSEETIGSLKLIRKYEGAFKKTKTAAGALIMREKIYLAWSRLPHQNIWIWLFY